MPSKLLTEWASFFVLEDQEMKQKELMQKAESGMNKIKIPKKMKKDMQ
jgi:hypothetical protein